MYGEPDCSSLKEAGGRKQAPLGLGPLQVSARDMALIYSSVDNMTALAYHLAPNHTYTAPLLQHYGPQVHIQRFAPGSGTTPLLSGAGNPAVQPQ